MVFPNWSRDVFLNNLSENNLFKKNAHPPIRKHHKSEVSHWVSHWDSHWYHTGIQLVSNWHSADMCAVRLSLARARTPAMISHMAMPSRRRPRGRPRCSHTRPAMILRVSRPASRQASMPPHKPCYGFAHTEAESRPASRQASMLPYTPCYGLVHTEAESRPASRGRPRCSHTCRAIVLIETRPRPTRNYILLLKESDSASAADPSASGVEF